MTLGAVTLHNIFDEQKVLIFLKVFTKHTHIKKKEILKMHFRKHMRKLITLKTQQANNKTAICSAVNMLCSRSLLCLLLSLNDTQILQSAEEMCVDKAYKIYKK